jgi:hypothetical protein
MLIFTVFQRLVSDRVGHEWTRRARSQGCNTGSNPVGSANKSISYVPDGQQETWPGKFSRLLSFEEATRPHRILV